MTVTSKKWQWIQSRKCYGNVSSKVSKYLCKDKKTGRVVPNISPTRPNLASKTQGAINTVGRGSSCDVKQVAASINERESRQTDGDVKSWLESEALIHSVEYWTPLGQYVVKFVFYNKLTDEGLVIRCLQSIKEFTVKLVGLFFGSDLLFGDTCTHHPHV